MLCRTEPAFCALFYERLLYTEAVIFALTVQLRHGSQLSAMLPGIAPNKVIGRVTDAVTDDGPLVVGFQQVTPLGVGIVIVCLSALANGSGGIGVDRPGQNVAGIVVGPDRGCTCLLVILPDQLIGRIVSIAGGMGTVTDAGDVKGTENLSP